MRESFPANPWILDGFAQRGELRAITEGGIEFLLRDHARVVVLGLDRDLFRGGLVLDVAMITTIGRNELQHTLSPKRDTGYGSWRPQTAANDPKSTSSFSRTFRVS